MYGAGFDPGNLEPAPGEAGLSVGAGGFSAAPDFLPAPDQRAAWLAALVARDGATAVVRDLLQSICADRLMCIVELLCKQQFGVEPVLDDALGEVNTPRLVLPRLSSPRLASPRLASSAARFESLFAAVMGGDSKTSDSAKHAAARSKAFAHRSRQRRRERFQVQTLLALRAVYGQARGGLYSSEDAAGLRLGSG